MLHNKYFHPDQPEDCTTSTTENGEDSSLSGDKAYGVDTPSPEERRGAHKRFMSMLIGGGDDPRSKAEIHPPQDCWSWRKYGQKPIKGSPYPRGYYRCSSSKGCPARKQVERSRHDPNILLVTYCWEHNHPHSTTTKHHLLHHSAASTTAPASPISAASDSTSLSSNAFDVPSTFVREEIMVPDLVPDSNNFSNLDSGFFYGGSALSDSPALVASEWADLDVAVMLPIGEEDQFLFGDLGELPECSMVFRRGNMPETSCCPRS